MRRLLAMSCALISGVVFASGEIERLEDSYKKDMESYLNSNEFEKMIQTLAIDKELNETEKLFYLAGYIRAWISYSDHSVLKKGPGLGKIQNLEQGNLRIEFEGWLHGCKEAEKHGKSVRKGIEERLRRDP